jgi:hypothetical protein
VGAQIIQTPDRFMQTNNIFKIVVAKTGMAIALNREHKEFSAESSMD